MLPRRFDLLLTCFELHFIKGATLGAIACFGQGNFPFLPIFRVELSQILHTVLKACLSNLTTTMLVNQLRTKQLYRVPATHPVDNSAVLSSLKQLHLKFSVLTLHKSKNMLYTSETHHNVIPSTLELQVILCNV